MEETEIIDSFRDRYFFLSNFYPCDIYYKGLKFYSAEAAFQAQKCKNEEDKEIFCRLTASEAKRHGRRIQLREDWEEIKLSEMYHIVKKKFSLLPFRNMLVRTGSCELIEGNTWGDTFWGYDVNKKMGQNQLGKILMKVRQEIEDYYFGVDDRFLKND